MLFITNIIPLYANDYNELPIIELPDLRIDNPAAYQGYTTRFYRDTGGNTIQIALDNNTGRIVHLLANGANESISFTIRTPQGQPEHMFWNSEGAHTYFKNNRRFVEYKLRSSSPQIKIGMFLLGSMRKEREYQYFKKHLEQFGNEGEFIEPELIELITLINRLPSSHKNKILRDLNATSDGELEARLLPSSSTLIDQYQNIVHVNQYTFDNKNFQSLELLFNSDDVTLTKKEHYFTVRSHSEQPINVAVRISSDSPSLTPLRRDVIFNNDFLDFYERIKTHEDSKDYFHRLDRQIRSIELLSFEEKLMAGLPNFATYFGRDMIVSALMLESITTPQLLENVISSVLEKLDTEGRVSHEEALGGQAIRQNAAAINSLLKEQLQKTEQVFDEIIRRIKNLQSPVENYIMVDDNFQLPVLVSRYLNRSDITSEEKEQFLLSSVKSSQTHQTHLSLILRNLRFITAISKKYIEEQSPLNFISFPKMPSSWYYPGSWRDSNAGYAGGRFALDVNAIWAPHALTSTKEILTFLKKRNFTVERLSSIAPEFSHSQLEAYYNEPRYLENAIETWREAKKYFSVQIGRLEIQDKISEKLEWLSDEQSAYWSDVLNNIEKSVDGITFYALSLDKDGEPVPVVNTDPAMMLFLENFADKITEQDRIPDELTRILSTIYTPYPIGLFVEGLGPLVANDVYSTKEIWERFKNDDYHSPTTVWGREVNLLLLGLINNIRSMEQIAIDDTSENIEKHKKYFLDLILTMIDAVESSGMKHTELWTYSIYEGILYPLRYSTTSDIQLWSLTELTVQFYLNQLSIN